jgi:vWA-MoxR associated protein C-terminal domain/vWA-MoxR associated protein middle region 0/Trypsin-like peptidase domain
MGTRSWHARVVCRGEVGAGFLVTDRHVVTCAHVVFRDDRAAVRFVGHPALGDIEATVVARGGWAGGATDPGDVAVLELDRPVTIAPAAFAGPQAAYGLPSPKLVAYGFPRGYDEGTIGEYRVASRQLVRDEWVHLEAWTGHGQPLAPGFSGAAAVLEESGAVAGMISLVSGDPRIRTGRMLPPHVLARYWPPAADLVPTPGFTAPEKRALRELLERVELADTTPEAVYRAAVGPLGPEPARVFRSWWDAAWDLMTEVLPEPGLVPVAEFAAVLAGHVPDALLRAELRAWARRHRQDSGAPAAGGTPPQWSPILVEIEPSGVDRNAFRVEVSAYRAGRRRMVAARTLRKGKVRAYVQESIDDAFREIDHNGNALIAFALPRPWLNQPIDSWERSRDDPTPLGCFSPLVVMDAQRRRSGALQYKIQKKWEILDKQPAAAWHRVECGTTADPRRLTVRLGSCDKLVGFGEPPRTPRSKKLLEAGLNAAVPVLVWPRDGCRGDHAHDGGEEDGCPGRTFLDSLTSDLAELPPAELPRYVRNLREQAYTEDSVCPHWADQLTLLWEDPRCFPDVADHQRSPVS